jgi:hypothetical protein
LRGETQLPNCRAQFAALFGQHESALVGSEVR